MDSLDSIDIVEIKKAARIINQGGLVAFPTETVYGLGADTFNPTAIAKIFEVKKRPLDNPLIVHIGDKEDLFKLAKDVPNIAQKLIDRFWPGPLTFVLKKHDVVPDIVTAGLDTVAIRMPANEIALSLIKYSNTPIAAPSANPFSRPSPTTVQHVLDDFGDRIDMVIDGGLTSVGLESTVLDVTQKPPSILRPGGVSIEELKEIDIEIKGEEIKIRRSPGMYPRHYSPKAKVILVEGNSEVQVGKVKNLASEFDLQGYYFGIMAKEENKDKYIGLNVKLLGPGNNLKTCAARLFSILREFDREGADVIIAEGVKEEGIGMAIMDRLRKAQGAIRSYV